MAGTLPRAAVSDLNDLVKRPNQASAGRVTPKYWSRRSCRSRRPRTPRRRWAWLRNSASAESARSSTSQALKSSSRRSQSSFIARSNGSRAPVSRSSPRIRRTQRPGSSMRSIVGMQTGCGLSGPRGSFAADDRGKKSACPVVAELMDFATIRQKPWRAAAAAAGVLLLLAAGGVAVIAVTAPPVESLRDYRPPQASLVFDRDGKLLARLAPEERIVVPLSSVSPKLVAAFLAVEDNRFYDHSGIDWRRVAGAIWRDFRTFSLREGSSTITMQLARNVFPDSLTRARTLRRKLAEMIVARRIERTFSKEQILEMYLNQIYLANGYYGVEAAARGYFGRSAMDLSLPQAAVLA